MSFVKPWPRAPRVVDCFSGAPYPSQTPLREGRHGFVYEPSFEYQPEAPPHLCKHGDGSCEACGTTVRRDAPHVTRGGRGVVGRISR